MSDHNFSTACPSGNTLIDCPNPKETQSCYLCAGTKRVWCSKEELYEFLYSCVDMDTDKGLRYAVDCLKDWAEDNHRPCPECGGN